jgi:thiol-disulfide isomerase/thioredoxin
MRWLAIAMLVLGAMSGCDRPKNLGVPGPIKPGPPAIKVQIGGAPELEKLIAAHKGEVVLVDYWATWCPSCVEKFPHIVELAKKHNGLAVISVSLDDPDKIDSAKEFLAGQDADFEHLLSKDGGSTDSVEAFKLDKGVPHYRLYDRAGTLVKEWGIDTDDMDAAIEAELAKT